MPSAAPSICLVVLAFASFAASAQVYRCGTSPIYTDKPCAGATNVDVRPNLLDGQTRQIPADPPPAPAVIPPTSYDPPKPSGLPSNVWDRHDAADAEFRNRTGSRMP